MNSEYKEDKYWKKRNKYAKDRTQSIKPPLSKIRLVDPNSGGVLVERRKKRDNNNYYSDDNKCNKVVVPGMMDLDDVDEEIQKRFILLLKLGLHMKKVFIAKRKNICKK